MTGPIKIDGVETKCPCGAAVIVGKTAGRDVVGHSLPQCADFSNRDPVAYLRWLNAQVRKRLGR